MNREMPGPPPTSGIVEQDSYPLVGSGWIIDVVRYQPTERPIEDRWSYTYEESSARLIVGVYDGEELKLTWVAATID